MKLLKKKLLNFIKNLEDNDKIKKCSCGAKKEIFISSTPGFSPQECSKCGERIDGYADLT
jgi:hypothetical protein